MYDSECPCGVPGAAADLAAAAASDVVNCSVSRARSTFDLALSCYAKARYAYYDASTESRSLAKYHFLLDIFIVFIKFHHF